MASGAQAQTTPAAPPPRLTLTLEDAVARGLSNNLAVRVDAEKVRAAEGGHERSLSALRPHFSANFGASDQTVSTAAFGFSSFPGLPTILGPFALIDARVAMSAALYDATAHGDLGASDALLRSEQHAFRNTRELVILTVANLYLEALADASRVEAAKAQVATAEALATLAADQKAAGVVAGIDVVRQQVQVQAARQRLLVAQNAFDKLKLRLGRAIGLQADQPIDLSDRITYSASPVISATDALALALSSRDDLKAAEAKVGAARASQKSASGGNLPSVHFDGNYGVIGATAGSLDPTFFVGASVHVPIFDGGSARGKTQQASAEVKQREAELADLRSGISFEIAAAILDLETATAAVDVAKSAQGLAAEELTQAQDRFQAGLSNSIELAHAQEAVASASDSYIASVYAHNLAKGALARAMGVVEERLTEFLGGRR
jgi:outer membrane protein TolC